MKYLLLITSVVLLMPHCARSQETALTHLSQLTRGGGQGIAITSLLNISKYHGFAPLSPDERFRLYLLRTYGPGSILSSITVASFEQWTDNPKEWKQGRNGYLKRIASSYATHAVQGTIEYGVSALLHEDNRYRPSLERRVRARAKHAILSTFTASDDAGHPHLAYSRIGAVTGTAFISRTWQPQSTSGMGSAIASLGFALGARVGSNVFHEFGPDLKRHFLRRKSAYVSD
jgi:hypothetical protein